MQEKIAVLEGKVVYGKQLGRTIGFPTANIDVEGGAVCSRGVYYGVCEADGRMWRVIVNIGSHPTAPEGPPTVEAYLIGYEGNLYGERLRVVLKKYLRPEVRFPSLDALRDQLKRDMDEANGLPI